MLGGQASFARLSATFTSGTRQAGPLALERFQNKGLVGLDDPGELMGLSSAGAERNRWRQRNAVVTATPQRSAALIKLSPVIRPASAPPNVLSCADEPRGSGQRVETAVTIAAAVALETAGVPPPLQPLTTAVRATREIHLALSRRRQRNWLRRRAGRHCVGGHVLGPREPKV